MLKRIIYNIAIITVFVLACDFFIGRTLRYFYFKQTAGLQYRTTYSMDSTTANILILGSSRANHHYVPEIFEKRLGMSFYNTGRDGNSILYNYAILKVVLRRYTPEIVILDFRPDDFFYSPISYDRLSSLLPYYSDHPEIRSIISLRGPYEKVKLFSAIYPYNSLLTSIGIGNLNLNKERKPDNKGYVALHGKMNETDIGPFQNNTGSIDTNKIKALDSISILCYKMGIKLFLCYSPFYYHTKETKIDTILQDISNKFNFKYLNFSNNPFFLSHPYLFRDKSHLNSEGALLYSNIVIDSVLLNLRISSQTR
jgi:hypothetical protein